MLAGKVGDVVVDVASECDYEGGTLLGADAFTRHLGEAPRGAPLKEAD